jgi:hypothetical protein
MRWMLLCALQTVRSTESAPYTMISSRGLRNSRFSYLSGHIFKDCYGLLVCLVSHHGKECVKINTVHQQCLTTAELLHSGEIAKNSPGNFQICS